MHWLVVAVVSHLKDAIFPWLTLQPVVTSYFALPPQKRCWLRRGAGAQDTNHCEGVEAALSDLNSNVCRNPVP